MLTIFVLLLSLITCYTPAVATDITLSVKERAGVNRTNAPVTYGVPFAKDANLLTTEHLSVVGKEAQFKVLSRYAGVPSDGTKPIRMVLVDFQDSVSANATNTVTLTTSGNGTMQANNLAIDHASFIEISTGSLNIQVSKTSGNIFENVVIDGTSAVSSPTDDKFTIVFDGTSYFSTPTAVAIEENGPLRCVVKVNGIFADKNGNNLIPPVTRIGETPDTPIRYTIRYFAYRNKSFVKLQTTLKNENFGWAYKSTQAAHNIRITEAYLKTTVNGLGSKKTISFDGYSAATSSNDTYSLLQQETSDGLTKSYSFGYNITKNGNSVTTGEKYNSFSDLRDDAIGLMVTDRWFWQNYPIGITISEDTVKFNLWPAGSGTYRILGSIWKTHELLYYFHGTDTNFNNELAHIKNRLIAVADADYYANTDFVWGIVPEHVTSGFTFPAGEKMQEVIDSIDKSIKALFDATYIENKFYPNTVLSLRQGRKVRLSASPDVYATGYGWLEFGAMARAANYGYHNQHYDWGFLALSSFLRFKNYSTLDTAEELLMHKTDILKIHDPDAIQGTIDYEYHGGVRYEQDALFSYYEDYSNSGKTGPRKPSHHWTKDLTLQYLLSGEQLYYDSLYESFVHINRIKTGAPMYTSETRDQFRGIDIACNGTIVTGEKRFLDDAWYLFESALLVAEGGQCTNRSNFLTCTGDGTSGWIPNGYVSQYDLGPGGDAWMVESLVKLYYLLDENGESTRKAKLKAFLFRWAQFVKNEILEKGNPTQGTYRNNLAEYSPFIAHKGYTFGDGYNGGFQDRTYLQPYAELFSFMYREAPSNNNIWLNLARVIEKDTMFYTANKDQFLPTRFSVGGGIQGLPADGSLASGSFKTPKYLTKAAFYLKTEYIATQMPLSSTPVINTIERIQN